MKIFPCIVLSYSFLIMKMQIKEQKKFIAGAYGIS